MKRFIFAAGLLALTFGLSACGTDVNSGDPPDNTPPSETPTPVAGAYLDMTLDGVNFVEHDGQTVMVRIVHGPNVIACEQNVAVSAGAFTVTLTDVLMEDEDYRVEIVAHTVDGDANYNSGVDRTFMIELPAAEVTADVEKQLDATVGEQGIGWPIGTACPS